MRPIGHQRRKQPRLPRGGGGGSRSSSITVCAKHLKCVVRYKKLNFQKGEKLALSRNIFLLSLKDAFSIVTYAVHFGSSSRMMIALMCTYFKSQRKICQLSKVKLSGFLPLFSALERAIFFTMACRGTFKLRHTKLEQKTACFVSLSQSSLHVVTTAKSKGCLYTVFASEAIFQRRSEKMKNYALFQ
jgi:hypothetical protein